MNQFSTVMSLLAKITTLNLLLALIAFSLGGFRVYQKFRYEIQRETDFTLMESFDELEQSLRSGVEAADLETRFMRITPVAVALPDTTRVLSDTVAMHPILKRTEVFRKLVAFRQINGQTYRFMVMNVVIEQSDIRRIARHILQDLFIVLGGILLVFNFIFSRRLFRPFKETLGKIKTFTLQSGELPVFPKTTTSEFKLLNDFLSAMLHKAQQDYRSLKEFSENASHEMQTPLAVASGKLELLLETPELDDGQVQLVQEAKEAMARLSKMGESLLLLTKIENLEFVPEKAIDFTGILQKNLTIFSDLAGMKGLQFSARATPSVMVRIDPSLAHILIGNLLKNAIRHNVENGWIKVELNAHSLKVSNSGAAPPVPVNQLFKRFQKSNQSNKSLGLGLSIAKKICDVNGIAIDYTYQDGVHQVECSFNML